MAGRGDETEVHLYRSWDSSFVVLLPYHTVLGITQSANYPQYVPYWRRNAAMDEKLQKIIEDLTAFLEEHSEGQPYPWSAGVDEGHEGAQDDPIT